MRQRDHENGEEHRHIANMEEFGRISSYHVEQPINMQQSTCKFSTNQHARSACSFSTVETTVTVAKRALSLTVSASQQARRRSQPQV